MGIIDNARANAMAKAQQEAEATELHNAMQGRALMEAIARQRMQPQVVDVTPRNPGLAQDIYDRDRMQVLQGARPQLDRQQLNLQGR